MELLNFFHVIFHRCEHHKLNSLHLHCFRVSRETSKTWYIKPKQSECLEITKSVLNIMRENCALKPELTRAGYDVGGALKRSTFMKLGSEEEEEMAV